MTPLAPEFDTRDVTVVQRTPGYRGFFAIDTLVLKHRLYAGGWSKPFTRELFLREATAGVLLYDPDLDAVVLVEQFRVGALLNAQGLAASPWLLEIVAGILEPDEEPELLARREALEEAGCEINELVHISDYYNSPGGSNEHISLYCGRVDASAAGGLHGLAEENEDIRAYVVPFAVAWQALQDGRMNNAMAIIAMQWLYINRGQLRERWLAGGKPAA